MQNILIILQIIISVSLITVVLLQKRGTGLGGAFGGGGGATYTQKRGAEKVLFNITIVLGILFVGVAFVILLAS